MIIHDANPELDVFCTSNTGEYEYCAVNTAGVSGLNLEEFKDEHGDYKEVDVFVIDEQ
jgi:hypothetical protein